MRLTPKSIRIIRVHLGMTQLDLAKLTGLSSGFISAIEREDRKMQPHHEAAIRQAFGLDDATIEKLLSVSNDLRIAG
ncbi:helix-turn-helix domain-containing protein [Effusibacillus pohliae]|uniref:helix-turn-helix domain-containing protein n=1 Tax=Effusibacillus pohliae TaxID=232270 RepID=UPI00035F5147|nr:helix-turn-helix transcriptional regulator [Effusibacillus pohliae]